MKVLAIETSCDETAAAVISRTDERSSILSNIVHSQIAIHNEWGGVVPEIASREHIRVISKTVRQAVDEAGGWTELDAVCATRGPGLLGPLLVGLQFSKGVSLARNLPWLGVHHLEGHLCAADLSETPPRFPHLSLLVSGGHTMLIAAQAFGEYKTIGSTLDDAAGEAFDKIAKILGLGYPGGKAIDESSQGGDPERFELPQGLRSAKDPNFSFSGLKTQAIKVLKEHGELSTEERRDFCAALQSSIVGSLVKKTIYQAKKLKLPMVVIGGGVAANSQLRREMGEACQEAGIECVIPPRNLCTDNAAMIGAAGIRRLMAGESHEYTRTAKSRWGLDSLRTDADV